MNLGGGDAPEMRVAPGVKPFVLLVDAAFGGWPTSEFMSMSGFADLFERFELVDMAPVRDELQPAAVAVSGPRLDLRVRG